MFIESAIIFLLMVSIVVKANLVSMIFLIFIFKFAVTRSKTELLVRANTYSALLFMVQYTVYLMNLTAKTSPQEFPIGFAKYPMHKPNKNGDKTEMNLEFPVPWFFHYDYFKKYDLKLAYLLGIGIDRD